MATGTHSPWGKLSPSTGDLAAARSQGAQEQAVFVASQSKLIWWRFRKHKLAMVSVGLLIVFYLTAILAEFVAPYEPAAYFVKYKFARPTSIHLRDDTGRWHWPFVYSMTRQVDPDTLESKYIPDFSKRHPLRLFVRSGPTYKPFGVLPIESNLHLFGLDVAREVEGVFLLGTDRMGRDVFSRVVFGSRLSLSVGLVGIAFSFLFGVTLGGISGYFGGWADALIQRIIEFIRSVPDLPLWMSLSAALPGDWPIEKTYFAITIILSLIGWTGLARVVRGRFLSLREEDFVMAARLCGAGEMRVILRHMLPSFGSYIIASLTLSVPGMILGETGLSFIGLGMRDPAISWGVLLQDAQQVSSLATAPWLLTPAIFVVVTVVAFNFMGDGLRDAADPYGR